MKFLPLLSLFALLAVFTSCLPDAGATLTPEVVEIVEEPEITTNFNVDGAELEIGYGYLFKISEDEALTQHHLVLTAADVQEEGAFTGRSRAITITINAASNSDLSGEYDLNEGSDEIGTATAAHYYQNLGFSQGRNYEQGYYDNGTVLISRDGEEYIISLNLITSFGNQELKGTFQGEVSELDLLNKEPADETLFQGANKLIYGEREVELNHAYLMEYGNADSGDRRYRLYLSAENIAPDAAVLTGRSDLIFFYVNEEVIDKGGKFTFATAGDVYLSQFIRGIDSGYYCKNMDFLRNTADEDTLVGQGEVDIEIDGEHIIIAFTGQSNAGQTATGLFRGPIMLLD
jgi:hypothetical protein